MSGTITTPAAKFGSYAVRSGRSAHQCTSLYSPPVMSSCSQKIHSDTLPTYMCFGLAGRGQMGLEENTVDWKGKASSTISPTIHWTLSIASVQDPSCVGYNLNTVHTLHESCKN